MTLMTEFAAGAMAARLAAADHLFHVAESSTQLAGVVALRGNSHLYLLFVDKRWQRKGLARRLWAVARTAAPAGMRRYTVNASAYAVPAYERLGFRRTGGPHERSGVRYQPMEWLLSEAHPPR
jgi:GNAT superfamily N-acetyltransferase